MSNKSLQLHDVTTARSFEELRQVLRDNFEALRILIDGLTGERLESWTPVLRDGSVSMTGNLTMEEAAVKFQTGDEVGELRLHKDGYLQNRESSSDWQRVRAERTREDRTDDRALDTVYTNGTKKEIEVYIQVQIGGS